MPRVASGRLPAEPTSADQWSRYRRILREAARQGDLLGYDGVQMAEVAKDSGVAIATLYRYFPSKVHLFTAILRDQLLRASAEEPQGDVQDPVSRVSQLLTHSTAQLLSRPNLTRAMLQANNSAHASSVVDAGRVDHEFGLWLATQAGRAPLNEEDRQLMRLLEQTYWGVLTRALNGRLGLKEAQGDVERACSLLLAPWTASQP